MTPTEKEEIKRELAKELREGEDESRRQAIAKLKGELREEIEKDALKREIISEVASKESQVYAFLKHPVTLLLVAFVLTTLLGTIIASCWKYWEWENEQAYLKTQAQCDRERQTRSDEIRQKYEVKDEIIKRVAETNTAAEEILLYFQMDSIRRKQLQHERTQYWQDATRAWRINEKILRQRLLLRFENRDVARLFETLGRYRGWVGININNQQEALSHGGAICREIVDQSNLCMSHVTWDLMPQVIEMMNKEILEDERSLRATKCATNDSSPTNAASPTLATLNTDKKTEHVPDACETLQRMADVCNSKKKLDSK
jgi:hypothetical protein